MDKVESHNQSGGVTAHTVNVGGAPASRPPKSRWKLLAGVVGALLAALAAIIAILQFFGLGPLGGR
jgi:hypothetical protein